MLREICKITILTSLYLVKVNFGQSMIKLMESHRFVVTNERFDNLLLLSLLYFVRLCVYELTENWSQKSKQSRNRNVFVSWTWEAFIA